MSQEQQAKLSAFINRISTSAQAREAFVRDPIESLKSNLNIEITGEENNLGIANELLLAMLQSPDAMTEIASAVENYEKNSITRDEAHQSIANTIWNASPDALKTKISNNRNDVIGNSANKPNFYGIANLVVAVDIAVVVTETVAFNSTYVGRAMLRESLDLQKIAAALAKSK
jgi:hypothetical protein